MLLCILPGLIYMGHRAQYLAEIEISEAATTWQQLQMAKSFVYADDTQLSNLPSKFQFSLINCCVKGGCTHVVR